MRTAYVSLTAAWSLLLCALASVSCRAVGAQSFGFTTSTDAKKWLIHSGAGLSITMTRASCDMVSIQYNGQELQYRAKATHINSGLGTVTSTIQELDLEGQPAVQVTCEKTGLTQYYVFRANENAVYMGTYHSTELPLGELRFLARLDRATVTTGIAEATLDDTTRAIEAHDVYATADNTTRSKFYSGVPFIDDQLHGVYGPSAGVYFVLSDRAYETSIGGPFYRDINNQCGTANDLTFYMHSDHTRTEDYRFGFHGPYALVFTDGPAPSSLSSATDFRFFQQLQNLTGFVPDTDRGRVHGVITDPDNVLTTNNTTVVVGFKNQQAQYWTQVLDGEWTYTSPLMIEGNYTVTVYKKQLAVATSTVEIKSGDVDLVQDLEVTYLPNVNAIWRIGEWDGTPDGFLNADKVHKMHPSDARMAPWQPLTFSVTEDDDAAFPMALFRGVNDPLTITCSLTEAQATASRTLTIGVTLAQNNGRTTVRVNNQWSGPVLATAAVKTRGVTRGTTTGNYVVYKYVIPASALVAGENAIALGIASGNTDPAEPFLHASVVFDALELA